MSKCPHNNTVDTGRTEDESFSRCVDCGERIILPPPGSWAETARFMAAIDPDMDWDAWKDEMKEGC